MQIEKSSVRSKNPFSLLPFPFYLLIFLLCVSASLRFVSAQTNMPCKFDEKTLQFAGSPQQQARCLLRPVKPRGVLGTELKKLPKPLDKIVGAPVKIKKEDFRKYLAQNNIVETEIGGSLDAPLVKAKLPDGAEIAALYFIIHDTSTPNYKLENFPADINENSWRFNRLDAWLKNPVAHVFVNRLGKSITTTPFSEPVAKGFGTKFARDFLRAEAKGLQLHIELVQPRRSAAEWFAGNDAIAPEPGFTDAQYERLAVLYAAASVRRGTWLIPAFHCAVDAGIKDAHDDPQNFDLLKFAQKLKRLADL
jgi:hypothetical protein